MAYVDVSLPSGSSFYVAVGAHAGQVKRKIALIGKGLTFDSGGYNLKVGGMIELMKFDMGGAGAVFGAAQIIADLQPAGVEVSQTSLPCLLFIFQLDKTAGAHTV